MAEEHKSHRKERHKQKHKGHGMGTRGVSRPMAEMQMMRGQQKDKDDQDKEQKQDHGKHKMTREQREQMLHMHHIQTLWVYWMIVMLGVWMILSPLTFSYGKATVMPSGGREVWLSMAERVMAMKWSDIISGLLLIYFGWRSLTPNRPVSVWICCFIGIWISIAPLLFWAPNAGAYINGTLVGALVIALTILIPGMPNMIMYMKMGGQVPAGWSYNPSSWPQRWIMIALGFVGWMVSRYLGAFQLGYIDHAWDPFFGEGTRKVLNSNMSHSWPISDGAFGALAYTFEFLMGWMGSPSRWRTMPWMVTLFGILVIPLGLVHIFLVISQPVMVGEWCTLCLLAAAIMLPMIPLEFDEVVAMGQHMVRAKKRGENLWKVFWKGSEPEEYNQDERSPKLIDLPKKPMKIFKASIWGMSFPWTLVVSTLLGLWLMFSPSVFGVGIAASAADINHLGGALIVVVSVICMGEVIRRGRYFNILLGLTVAIIPWFLQDSNLALNISGVVTGLIVAALAIPAGPKTETYGLWDKYVK
ncbi:hypothetical protein C900_00181 [Fulvivirga imtechensis AK7]|uniref:Uncharacterized protein n=1 Tax=Fulvivirga imtechensis AK7 TaxID=1237149 RepID=L8JML3_9BACT|nr:vitamin K epoxide reductase family protein [Fulvivirga imtechensis]ELR68637.1 hypothetical protein C900_00181 [Fulvivirga imtechensis AK7]